MTTTQMHNALWGAELDELTAQKKYSALLKRLLPRGTRVRINHWRGSYEATVDGYDPRSHRIRVQNHKTGKFSYAYPSMFIGLSKTTPCVELL